MRTYSSKEHILTLFYVVEGTRRFCFWFSITIMTVINVGVHTKTLCEENIYERYNIEKQKGSFTEDHLCDVYLPNLVAYFCGFATILLCVLHLMDLRYKTKESILQHSTDFSKVMSPVNSRISMTSSNKSSENDNLLKQVLTVPGPEHKKHARFNRSRNFTSTRRRTVSGNETVQTIALHVIQEQSDNNNSYSDVETRSNYV